MPEEVRPLIDAGFDHGVGEIADPVRVDDGWAVVRVTYRERAGYIPFEKAEGSVVAGVEAEKTEALMQELLPQWKERLRLRLHPERLTGV